VSTSDIAIGLVTALPLESAAMRLMVDNVTPASVNHDLNLDFTGDVPSRSKGRPHRVLIASQVQDGIATRLYLCRSVEQLSALAPHYSVRRHRRHPGRR